MRRRGARSSAALRSSTQAGIVLIIKRDVLASALPRSGGETASGFAGVLSRAFFRDGRSAPRSGAGCAGRKGQASSRLDAVSAAQSDPADQIVIHYQPVQFGIAPARPRRGARALATSKTRHGC